MLRIEGRIGRHPGDRKRMAVLNADGKPAVTRARVLERFGRGRRRRRWSSAGWRPGGPTRSACTWPLPGIRWSATRLWPAARRRACSAAFPRQALHAASLGFVHPVSGEAMRFEAPLPADSRALLAALRRM